MYVCMYQHNMYVCMYVMYVCMYLLMHRPSPLISMYVSYNNILSAYVSQHVCV
jgi:hypothetical protein